MTTPASLTVAVNAAPTAIGIVAPSDANYSAAQLTVTVTGLPSDGKVYLADGVTQVANGESLTVAQLTGLEFAPTAAAFSQSSSLTYNVTDPSALSASGSATLTIGPDTTALALTTVVVAGNAVQEGQQLEVWRLSRAALPVQVERLVISGRVGVTVARVG